MKKTLLLLIALLFIMTSTTTKNNPVLDSTWYSKAYFNGKKTADGTVVENNKKQRIVALSPDLFNQGFRMGDEIGVVSKLDPVVNGTWYVKDVTGGKRKNHIDFLLTKSEGKGFHNGKVTITYIKHKEKKSKKGRR